MRGAAVAGDDIGQIYAAHAPGCGAGRSGAPTSAVARRMLIAAAAEWSVTLHTNKGLAGGTPEAIAAARATAINPAAADAIALLICAADTKPAWHGIPDHEPDVTTGRREAERVTRAMAPIRRLVPDAGSYVSESDYFERDWQRSHWGSNYARLLAEKRRYDPKDYLGRIIRWAAAERPPARSGNGMKRGAAMG
ncbi:hypothetical protein FHS96_002220 [Sphingomonas zeicaulis]|uniref:BBE domain-containing protein n=1 Tax=Sphingomonas zeicaulis TaxID=1632740 RepID=UPI003D25F8D2